MEDDRRPPGDKEKMERGEEVLGYACEVIQ